MAGPRMFDHDEARRRHAAGASAYSLARDYGVTYNAVWMVVTPGAQEKSRQRQRAAYVGQGVCDDCGAPMNLAARKHGSTRCLDCAALARATSVRPDALQCLSCREWKKDDGFPHSRTQNGARRGRHKNCRVCQTILRRQHRDKNKVPCANGCGRLVLSLSEATTAARGHGTGVTGMCQRCFIATQPRCERCGRMLPSANSPRVHVCKTTSSTPPEHVSAEAT